MKYSIGILFFFLVMSCNLDDGVEPQEIITFDLLNIKEIFRNGAIFRDYSYNDEGQLISSRQYDNSATLTFKSDWEYLEDSTIVRVVNEIQEPISTSVYYKTDPLITRQDRYSAQDNLIGYFVYHYETANSCIYNKREEFNSSDELQSQLDIVIAAENCNFESVKIDENGVLINTIQFQHDDKKRFDDAVVNPMLPLLMGNLTAYTLIEADGETNQVLSSESNFEYNTSDYPIRETRFSLTGEIEEYLFDYF